MSEPKFKPGDRVHCVDYPHSAGEVVQADPDVQGRWLIQFDDWGSQLSMRAADLAPHIPAKPRPRIHPNSLANLAKGTKRREDPWKNKKLRLTVAACDWLERQPDQGRAVERLIMEEIKREGI